MKEYGRLFVSFWTSPDISPMSSDAKLLAAYLLTCSHGNMIGCFRLPFEYVCADLKWPSETVSKGFAELLANGFITHDEASNWVLIRRHFKWNPPQNPNQRKAAIKLIANVPTNSPVFQQLIDSIENFCPELFKLFRKGSETVSKSVTVAVEVEVEGTVAVQPPKPVASSEAKPRLVQTSGFTPTESAKYVCDKCSFSGVDVLAGVRDAIEVELKQSEQSPEQIAEAMVRSWHAYLQSAQGGGRFRCSARRFFGEAKWKQSPSEWGEATIPLRPKGLTPMQRLRLANEEK